MNHPSLLFLLVALFVVGCGTGEKVPEIVPVTGTIMMDGQPLDQVKVTFMPNGEAGNQNARSSWGETDENGKFVLVYQLPGSERDGASVGAHKVVLRDLIPNRARDEEGGGPLPKRRFLRKYSSATTTDLEANVKAGDAADFVFEVTSDQ